MESRLAVFVDGSNLFGCLQGFGLKVNNYEDFYEYVVERAVDSWKRCIVGVPPTVRLQRIYWYVVGSIDEWDLAVPRSQSTMRELFDRSDEVRKLFCEEAGRDLAARNQDTGGAAVADEAFRRFLRDREAWLADKTRLLDGMNRFHHAVSSSTDFIEVRAVGHWKVDFISRTLSEKGLDASLSVDMVTTADHYDIGLIVSGDADMLPSIRHAKRLGRQIGAVEFVRGHPPEKVGRGFSSKLRVEADFVLRIYATDLEREEFASR